MKEKVKGSKRHGGKYKISADGTDALLFFGKHRDKNLSDIAVEDVQYLEWMFDKGDFDDDLREVVKFNILRHYKKTKKKRWLEHKAMELGLDGDEVKKMTREQLEDYLMRNWDGEKSEI